MNGRASLSLNSWRWAFVFPCVCGLLSPSPLIADDYSAFFLDSLYGTAHVDVGTDGAGGRHMAFAEWNGDSVFYGYCAAACERSANWGFVEVFNSGVAFGREPRQVQLRIDGHNRPRIGFEVQGYGTASAGYFYAECDDGCLESSNWQAVKFADAGMAVVSASRWLALDASGRPRGLTLYAVEGFLLDQHVYLSYGFCNTACTHASNWTVALIGYLGNLGYLAPTVNTALELDGSGRPRVALHVAAHQQQVGSYGECAADCATPQQWQWVALPGLWSGSFDLALTGNGQPRLATHTGGTVGYRWCDGGCLDGANWQSLNLSGLPAGSGAGIGLVLDREDRPHIGHVAQGGDKAWYLHCAAGCETPGTAVWQNVFLESPTFSPLPFHPGCREPKAQAWILSGPVSLSLDGTGSILFGYTAANVQQSYCTSGNRVADVVLRKGRIGVLEATAQVHALTVIPDGAGSGVVTSDPPGIACGALCTASFPSGARLTLRASPDSGHRFGGWGGACSGFSPTCEVVMTADRSVTATFNATGCPGDSGLLCDAFEAPAP